MKVFIFALAALAGFANSQHVNNVYLMGHTSYMINILQEVSLELERREWCNLKVPDITATVNETVFDRHHEGTVTYSNGFVASIQVVDVLRAGVDQNWAWNLEDLTGTVHVRGTFRMSDLMLGYDVVAELEDGRHRYTMAITYPLVSFTFNVVDVLCAGVEQNWAWSPDNLTGTVYVRGTLWISDLMLGYDVLAELEDGHHRYTMAIMYPLVSFTFNIWKNVNTEAVRFEITGAITTPATINTIRFLPQDQTSDVLTTLFTISDASDGIRAWGAEVFPSITEDAYNKVEFPRICYDCPLAATMGDIINV